MKLSCDPWRNVACQSFQQKMLKAEMPFLSGEVDFTSRAGAYGIRQLNASQCLHSEGLGNWSIVSKHAANRNEIHVAGHLAEEHNEGPSAPRQALPRAELSPQTCPIAGFVTVPQNLLPLCRPHLQIQQTASM